MLGLGGCLAVLVRAMCTPPTLGRPRLLVLPGFKATSCLTVVLLVCLETVLLSTVSNCAKTFYMHWNTTNSIFRIDNTDHIIDVNKGNLAFEYDQVHIICPVYEPGTFDNETEKYIIYNVSKVEYETCRITNANPRIIAICDKPQKLMFFTITFRPFTPQPGGLEFLPGNDYYFISTSSKDDLHRRIGGRCSTNNMKVVFKVCCAAPAAVERPELSGGMQTIGGGHGQTGGDVASTAVVAVSPSSGGGAGGSGASTGGSGSTLGGGSAGSGQASNAGGSGSIGGGHGSTGVSINTNIEQRTNGRNNVNGGNNNNNNNYGQHNGEVPSTIGWPRWSHTQTQPTTSVNGQNNNNNNNNNGYQQFYPPSHSVTSARPMGGKNNNNNNNNEATNHQNNNSNYGPSHKPTKKTNEYDKHPNEVVKNEELTYNSAAGSPSRPGGRTTSTGSTAAGWWHRLALTVLLSAVALMRYFLSWSWSLAALLFGNDEYCSSSSSSRNSDTELRKQRRDRRRPQPRSDVSGDAVETRTALDEAAEPEPLLSSAVVQPLAAQQQQQHEQPPLQQRWLRWHRAQCERAVPQSSAGSCWKSDAERPSASGSRRPSLLPKTTTTTLSRSVTAAAWCQR